MKLNDLILNSKKLKILMGIGDWGLGMFGMNVFVKVF